jgi:maltose O-acetyltransferase
MGLGTVSFEEDVSIGVATSPLFHSSCAYLEARSPDSLIVIGSGTWINNGFCAIAEHTSISIGKNCLLGTSVEIFDSDFHGLKVEDRRESRLEWARPVRIGNNVFIGSNARILKGVTIGDGALIANSAVVTNDVPSGVVAGGNPAKVLKAIA